MLVKRGQYPEAEPLLLAAHEAHRTAGGADDPRTVQAAAALVGLYEAWGRPAEANPYRPE